MRRSTREHRRTAWIPQHLLLVNLALLVHRDFER
jgi:hypothetical protein